MADTNLLATGDPMVTASYDDPALPYGFGSTHNQSGLTQNPDAPAAIVLPFFSEVGKNISPTSKKVILGLAIAFGLYYAFKA